MKITFRTLLLSASVFALANSNSVSYAADLTNTPHAQPAAGAQHRSIGLTEVVVTAEKRKGNLQSTPAAITAISGRALVNAGITSPLDLNNVVPGVTFRTRGPVTQMFVRGVGSNIDSPQVLPGVATQMDQIYVPREATGGSFYDLANVEILPGPQGTLYGRDAAGGTVNVNFNKPTDRFTSDALLEVGNDRLIHATVVENIPINDKVMVRGAFDSNQHSGYLSNGGDDLASASGRLSVLLKPTQDLSILAWGSYWHNGGHGPEVVATPLLKPSDAWSISPSVPAGQSSFATTMLGGQADWRVGGMKLTYIPAYSNFRESDLESFASPAFALHAPGAGFNLSIAQHWNNYSQELRLGNDDSNASRLTWLTALYWYSQSLIYDRHQINDVSHVDSTVTVIPGQTNAGEAFYGQATYAASQWLNLTVGARAASDQVSVSGVNTPAQVPFGLQRDWRHIDWKIGDLAKITDTSNVYATIQTGFLRGGYSPAAISPVTHLLVPTTAVAPEKLLSYILGTKNRFLDNRLQVNDEFYYYNYNDYQISAINLVTNVSSFLNASRAVIYGNQLDTAYRLTIDDKVNLSLGLSHAKATDFNLPNIGNFSGYTLPNSPDITVTAGYEHIWELATGANLTFRADTHYESQSFLLYNHPNGSRQPAYTNSGMSLTYYSANGTWDLGVWVKNLENSAVYGAGATVGPIGAVYLGDPRTFGARLGLHF